MIVRLLLIAAAVWFGWKLWKNWQQVSRIAHEAQRQKDPERFEPMVRCARCGVHLPASALSNTGLCGKCAQ